ncbi:hypothetical protein Y032_0028g1705 [Ancylostoma ceylanicum]|uniref:Uncharacterized protein n=1 Tax=Ancylostoma ceylanicum TaxID=53326 RepID=A0A016UUL8_9BILA|nr:hypothetical protein Y032_0028g1705 [Ancylostoma ceylanicum]
MPAIYSKTVRISWLDALVHIRGHRNHGGASAHEYTNSLVEPPGWAVAIEEGKLAKGGLRRPKTGTK